MDLINESQTNAEIQWEEITEFVNLACADLAVGQLVHREGFHLMEAMSAIEVMDPKMDSGVNYASFRDLDERLKLKILPIPDDRMPNSVLIDIMDHLLRCQATWFSGFSLCQTLFTCLYLHKTEIITNSYLRTFVFFLLKSSESIRNLVIKADVYEEEDFVTHTFGFSLCETISEEVLSAQFQKVEDSILPKIKLAKKNPKKLGTKGEKELEELEGIWNRILFMRSFYTAQIHLDKPLCKGFEEAKKTLSNCRTLFDCIVNYRTLHGDIDESIEKKSEGKIKLEDIFDGQVARVMQGPAPSRVIPISNFESTKEIYENLLDSLEHVTLLPLLKSFNMGSCLEFFICFSSSNPNVVARSRLQVAFISSNKILGKINLVDFIKDSMIFSLIPPYIVALPEVNDFCEKITKSIVLCFKLLSLNRARQRRKIVRYLDDLIQMQLECEFNDGSDESSEGEQQLSCWVTDLIIFFMVHYLKLGFELELYHPTEYAAIFWYLDYLHGVQKQTKTNVYKQYNSYLEHESKKTGKKLSPPFPLDILCIETNGTLYRALYRMVFALHCTFPDRNLSYSPFSTSLLPCANDENRFYSRFGHFHKLTQPQPLFYQQFKETSDTSDLSTAEVILGTVECFKSAKSLAEKMVQNIKNLSPFGVPVQMHNPNRVLSIYSTPLAMSLIKVCVTNLLQLQMIENQKNKNVPIDQIKAPSLSFDLHKDFASLKLQ